MQSTQYMHNVGARYLASSFGLLTPLTRGGAFLCCAKPEMWGVLQFARAGEPPVECRPLTWPVRFLLANLHRALVQFYLYGGLICGRRWSSLRAAASHFFYCLCARFGQVQRAVHRGLDPAPSTAVLCVQRFVPSARSARAVPL